MCPMRFLNDLDYIVQVQYPPEWKSGHLDLTWSMSCVVRHKMGWEHFIHCIVGQVEFSNFFFSGEQMKINRNSKILFFFHSGKQMDPRRSPDLAEALSTHQGLEAVIDISVILSDALCMNCVRDVFKGLQMTQGIISTKEQNVFIQTVSLEIK